ncbi:class I SAM-dependent methyltransferase [Phreatobacter aquaticus]|uniref:Class I SAM-dependent methyltransferase n=1 Tax=Phreatobacter aquaticus TaxID=2570229 RepID=A0A4D7Q7U4_9HYPH|nr:class I SAM-dependent methyltransferase [Phreatobacter aquaticus]QCK84290.1 class I SAM-dependent methyltransferase [Phreatobacter aquaticus]
MSQFISGVAALDRYLADGYEKVRGMSSRFSATICGHVLKRQSALGIAGDVAEIGTFEGRFFIAMALALQPGEHAYGFDVFTWPDDKVLDRLDASAALHGLTSAHYTTLRHDSGTLDVATFGRMTGGKPLRFIHIDGDHSPEALTHDLALAHAALHPKGLICLDDMLHPGYPFLVVTVHAYLTAHPEMRLMCIIDREDIVAAPKFLICHVDAVPLYENDLMSSFQAQHFVLGGDAMGHHCVVLTPHPRIAEV